MGHAILSDSWHLQSITIDSSSCLSFGICKRTGDDTGVESVTIINSPVGSPTTAGCNGCTGDVRIEDGICYCPYVV